MRTSLAVVVLLLAGSAWAQESPLHAELRREGERVSDACRSLKSIGSCSYTLFTDHPLHIAAGSMPPENGFGVGGAFVWSKNTKNWRLSWDVDSVGAFNGSWRAGGYMKMVHNPHSAINPIKVTIPGESGDNSKKSAKNRSFTHPYTVFNIYAQTISLNNLNYFGVGNDTIPADKSLFGMSETIVGANVIKPVFELSAIRWLNLALVGEANGRFVSIRGEHGHSVPSIEMLYDNATAPGLSTQPAFAQFGQGIRIKPEIGNLQLNYLGKLQEFVASNSIYSFLRWTVDLDHTYSLYRRSVSGTSETLGPDSCAPRGELCPPVSRTRNLNGSINVHLLLSESITSGASVVPFYFQQTLGGKDLDGMLSLGSYDNYRFRAPNLLLLQESIEHSVWGPFGLKFMAEQGRVASTRGDIGFGDLKRSFAAGITLRAGAFPMVSLMFAWGGSEGRHTLFNMNTSLLGSSGRPPLD
ncbi:MAG TPA: hypothetical protein VN708_07085 [Terriglobales bacterium]|jgi:hypothetical protein|nr:hypothetical protein [Terriglobales bacterium]